MGNNYRDDKDHDHTMAPPNNAADAMMETKTEKFRRLATLRVNNALKSIDLVTQLANPNNYDWTNTDAKKIVKVLDIAIERMEKALGGKPEERDAFSFDDE